METATSTLRVVYKFRVRDKHSAELRRQAAAVNFVWNYLNETQQKAATSGRSWLSGFDLQKLTAGASAELNIHSHTIKRVCSTYYESRLRTKKPWLRWRGRKSLPWVPFNTGHVSFNGRTFRFRGVSYKTMHLRPELREGEKIGAGSFNADARGRWYINIPIELPCQVEQPSDAISAVGIDLGLHTLATLSTGEKIPAPRFYRESEAKIRNLHFGNKSRQGKAIHAKIANKRKDYLHKASSKICANFGVIFVGDIQPSKISRTHLAKSVYDAGWSSFKRMLSYKSIRNGGRLFEVPERNTSQICADCGSRPLSRPTGMAGLSKRMWTCDDCGVEHDRDVNAARNILRMGQHTLGRGALSQRSALECCGP